MKKLTAMLFVLLFVCISANVFSASEKKDIKDPVLKEMIASLSTKMPRFVDKHGQNLFVADEQITRESLVQALYEYDKKSFGKNASNVSKQELDSLKTRISALEKGDAITSGTKNSAKANVDIIQVMNDLEPNMPTLLDNSLNNSKVFKQLQKKVNEVGSSTKVAVAPAAIVSSGGNSGGITSAQLSDLRSEVSSLNKKYDTLMVSANKTSKVNSNVENLQKEVNSLTIKVNGLENNKESDLTLSQISNVKAELTDLNKKYDNLSTSLASTKNSKMSNAQVSANIVNMQKEMKDINSKVNALTLNKNVGVSSEQIENFKKEMSSMNVKINDMQKNIGITSGTGVTLSDSDKEKINENFSKISKKLSQSIKDYSNVEKRISSLEQRPVLITSDDPNKSVDNSSITYLEARIDSMKSTVENAPSKQTIKEQVTKNNKKIFDYIEKLEKKINSLEQRVKELERKK